jgi:hypothetical protein
MKKFTFECLFCEEPVSIEIEPSNGLGGNFQDVTCSHCNTTHCVGSDCGNSFIEGKDQTIVAYSTLQVWRETVAEHRERHQLI